MAFIDSVSLAMPKKSKLFSVENSKRGQWLVIRIRLPKLSFDRAFSEGLIVAGCIGIASVLSPVVLPSSRPEVLSVVPIVQAETAKPVGLPRSIPTHLKVPDIGVSTDLVQIGKNSDDTLEVPTDASIAGWYRFSPTPGEIGPAVITGHVDTYLGPGVFFRLKELMPGQQIYVTREDKMVVAFRVDRVAVFDQQKFPTEEVYGDIEHAGLRLITCGGTYDVLSGRYSENVVVYASKV